MGDTENRTSSRESEGTEEKEAPLLSISVSNEMMADILNIVDALGSLGEDMREQFFETKPEELEDENGDFAALAVFASVWAVALRIFSPDEKTYSNACRLAFALAEQYEEDLKRAVKIREQGTDYDQ